MKREISFTFICILLIAGCQLKGYKATKFIKTAEDNRHLITIGLFEGRYEGTLSVNDSDNLLVAGTVESGDITLQLFRSKGEEPILVAQVTSEDGLETEINERFPTGEYKYIIQSKQAREVSIALVFEKKEQYAWTNIKEEYLHHCF
ncbi:hypothetical protein PZE06_16780 [Robertmurraya sp. DFI.2.37]|uniref:hypothetical protein n=1 Tax=Robertmurraya sp. DFI.2.37 TaxID=3031819 RepID=UPI001248942C|nr:hypothetical protein [Robertmurraya sp. DFI.2.37]MDF1509797.1 hypothetical protein [Robertmurraya sp. DFI.2.37]